MFVPSNFIDRLKLPFRKDRELYASFYEILGFYPHHIHFYKLALQHKSTSQHAKSKSAEHNERLEYLGDAILESVVSDFLYHHYADRREGFLTNTRSKIVSRESLNRLAKMMGLDRLIQSNTYSNSHNSYMGGNAFEALIGAIYLDRGYDACMYFLRHRILGRLLNIDTLAAQEMNFKSKLIEWTQRNHVQLEFKLVEERCDNYASPLFVTQIVIEGLDCEKGKGYSKKESHQAAAKATLRSLKSNKQLVQAIFDAKSQRTAQEEEPVQTVPETEEA